MACRSNQRARTEVQGSHLCAGRAVAVAAAATKRNGSTLKAYTGTKLTIYRRSLYLASRFGADSRGMNQRSICRVASKFGFLRLLTAGDTGGDRSSGRGSICSHTAAPAPSCRTHSGLLLASPAVHKLPSELPESQNAEVVLESYENLKVVGPSAHTICSTSMPEVCSKQHPTVTGWMTQLCAFLPPPHPPPTPPRPRALCSVKREP